jgi:hypothetical protein
VALKPAHSTPPQQNTSRIQAHTHAYTHLVVIDCTSCTPGSVSHSTLKLVMAEPPSDRGDEKFALIDVSLSTVRSRKGAKGTSAMG